MSGVLLLLQSTGVVIHRSVFKCLLSNVVHAGLGRLAMMCQRLRIPSFFLLFNVVLRPWLHIHLHTSFMNEQTACGHKPGQRSKTALNHLDREEHYRQLANFQ
jgi:hypothetical protein